MYSWACINFLPDMQSVFLGVQKRGNGSGRDFLSCKGTGSPGDLGFREPDLAVLLIQSIRCPALFRRPDCGKT